MSTPTMVVSSASRGSAIIILPMIIIVTVGMFCAIWDYIRMPLLVKMLPIANNDKEGTRRVQGEEARYVRYKRLGCDPTLGYSCCCNDPV
jgi:hypothetical protein